MSDLCALPDVNWAKQSQRQHSQNVPTSTICDQAYSTLVQEGRCDFFVRSCFVAKRQVVWNQVTMCRCSCRISKYLLFSSQVCQRGRMLARLVAMGRGQTTLARSKHVGSQQCENAPCSTVPGSPLPWTILLSMSVAGCNGDLTGWAAGRETCNEWTTWSEIMVTTCCHAAEQVCICLQ